MISFANEIYIARPIEEVYAYLSDLEHTPDWNWAITETKKTTAGPAIVGTRYRQARSIPRPATEFLEITALEPNQLIEVRGTLAGYGAHVSYYLTGTSAGTDLTNTVELHPAGALRLVAPIVGRRIKQAVADNLGELKSHLEGSRAGQSVLVL